MRRVDFDAPILRDVFFPNEPGTVAKDENERGEVVIKGSTAAAFPGRDGAAVRVTTSSVFLSIVSRQMVLGYNGFVLLKSAMICMNRL